MPPLPRNGKHQRGHRHRKKDNDKVAFEPVLRLSPIEYDFKASKRQSHGEDSPSVDPQPAVLARRLHFARELRRVRPQPAREPQRDDAEWNVDEEKPSTAPGVR